MPIGIISIVLTSIPKHPPEPPKTSRLQAYLIPATIAKQIYLDPQILILSVKPTSIYFTANKTIIATKAIS